MRFLKQLRFKLVELLLKIKSLGKKPQKSEEDEPVFFIMGSGRNGSTLLARLLNNHSDIFLPPEQFALPFTIADWQFSRFKSWTSFYQKQLKRYLKNNQSWKLEEKDFKKIESELRALDKEERGPGTIFKQVFERYAKKFGGPAKLYGDHSPLSTEYYKYIYHEFPDGKYIFLLRHPYDVVLSYSKMKEHKASDPEYAAWKWNNSIKAYDYLKKKNCDVLLVKYRDLVSKPEEVTEKIQDFLDIDPQNVINAIPANPEEDPLGAGTHAHHQKLYKAVDASSVGKWKEELAPEIIEQIEESVEENAARFHFNLHA